jgi:hypothetical protein
MSVLANLAMSVDGFIAAPDAAVEIRRRATVYR